MPPIWRSGLANSLAECENRMLRCSIRPKDPSISQQEKAVTWRRLLSPQPLAPCTLGVSHLLGLLLGTDGAPCTAAHAQELALPYPLLWREKGGGGAKEVVLACAFLFLM